MSYTVKSGDTLSFIAKRFGTTVEALVASNGIADKDKIYVGQTINIPENKPNNTACYNALITCLEAIESLPEFKALEGWLNG
jgi:murein DD-endopeptidase MepM/ murein hydrolase activator NlpD